MEFEMICRIIADVLSVDESEITLDTSFSDDLGADSIDLFQIIMGIEEELDIEVDTEVAQNVKTVGEACELIRNTVDL